MYSRSTFNAQRSLTPSSQLHVLAVVLRNFAVPKQLEEEWGVRFRGIGPVEQKAELCTTSDAHDRHSMVITSATASVNLACAEDHESICDIERRKQHHIMATA
jgi:hypothetical protein